MWTTERPGLEVTPGFLLLMGALFWLAEGVGLLPWGALACLLHELGHVTAARLCGGRVERLVLSAVGAELTFDYLRPLSYSRDSMVALAGPAVNLAAGAFALAMRWYLPAALSLGVGAFNLLPVRPLDGGRALYDMAAGSLDPDWAERITTAAAGCVVGVLVGMGAVAAAKFANVTLLLTALWLLARTFRAN